MTTLEFAKKNLEKARGNLERAKLKTGTTEEEMAALDEKIVHWEGIVTMIELEISMSNDGNPRYR